VSVTDRLIGIGLRIYIFLGFLFIFTPIVALIVFSFNVDRFPSLPWQGFSTKWYSAALSDDEVLSSFKNSLVVGAIVAGISTFLGSTAAYFLTRWRSRIQGPYLALAVLPPCIPLIILALALRIFFQQSGMFQGSLWSIIVSHVVLASAFAMGIVRMRLTEMDPTLEEAAWNLGSSQWRTIREVVLPQALPAIVAALLITMAVSWDEFVIAWFVSGFDITLPVKIFNLVQGTISPQINAIGSIVFGMTITLVVLAQLAIFVWGRMGRTVRDLPAVAEGAGVGDEAVAGEAL
jgi:spermidine/putrescine transport system permease protein